VTTLHKIGQTLTTALLAGSLQLFQLYGQTQTTRSFKTDVSDGGSIGTNAYATDSVEIDKNSTLHRVWLTVNDWSCPIQLTKAGVKTIYVQLKGLNFVALYRPIVESFFAKQPVTAMEMRFALYDVFNEHITTLEATRVEDVASAGPFMFKQGFRDLDFVPPSLQVANTSAGEFARVRAMEDDVKKNPTRFDSNEVDAARLLTVVSFVSRVRSQDGTIWKFDPTAVAAEIEKLLHSQVAETILAPVGAGH